MIPYGRQSIDESDIKAVTNVLKSDWLTQGPNIDAFEKSVAEFCGAKYAVAVSSATAGLHLAYLASGLKAGDRLWTTANTFAATANAALYCDAILEFIDIDPQTFNISISCLSEKLEHAEKNGTLPKIIVPVHFAGQSCNMEQIQKLSSKYGFKIIEDAAHAIGGEYKKSKIGLCQFSESTVFSFHPVKIVTSGEGGVVVTNNPEIFNKIKLLRSHGITKDESKFSQPALGPWYQEQIELGFHYRMTDIQAVLGTNQVKRIDTFLKRRRELAKRYDALFEKTGLPVIKPYQAPDTLSAWHLYVIQFELEKIKATHKELFELMRAADIGVNLHYIPVYLHPYYQKLGFKKGLCLNAENYFKSAMSLPIYYSLTNEQQDFVVERLTEILK
jgi:UDP-4-amino-4,6-dideoxy-N-acetyl-beta-L-altrosamine transaminase